MQALLTNAIEIVFWAFVTLFIVDFINGLFPQLPDIKLYNWEVEPKEPESTPCSNDVAQNGSEFVLLPDPWLDNTEETATPVRQVASPQQKLLLLPSGNARFDSMESGATAVLGSPQVEEVPVPSKTRTASPLASPQIAEIPQVASAPIVPKRKRGRPKKSA
ncbi:hypothetical protein LC593_10640 [Nostoc sp. CHAB 5844]|nr:hypothetical protein [Nostoc sp. CHAB 5844]